MKVAIVGGGFSGLACAHELERNGISPDIYEKKSFIGEPMNHVTAVLEIVHRPIRDCLGYFKENLNLDIEPINKVKSLVHFAPNAATTVKGKKLGYFLENTASPTSIKQQLLRQLKTSRILLNQEVDPVKLKKDYDYVVVASGNYSFSQTMGIWQDWFQSCIRGAVVHGNFDPGALVMWLNKDYCKNGYAYLAPFNESKAALVFVTTDVNEREIDHYWELFLYSENIKYTITEEFKLEHRAGFVYPLMVENVLMVGNAAGGLEPFLGFGHFNAVMSGVTAGSTIARGMDYEKQLKHLLDRNKDMRQFRKMFNTLTNKGYDNLIMALRFPGFRTLAYNSPLHINLVRLGGIAGNLLVKSNRIKG